MEAGLASYLALKERLSLEEACDLHEVLTAKIENEHRAHDAAERRSKEQ